MNRIVLCVAALIALMPVPSAGAECDVDNWRLERFDPAYQRVPSTRDTPGIISLSGTTTCPAATINIRLFSDDRWVGNARGHSTGFAFRATAIDVLDPGTVGPFDIRYTVETRD